MSFKFNADELTIRTLFKNYSSFEIPSFQRDYSWNALYYRNFFDDIINSISQEDQENYFIGTMVFSNLTKENKTDVVDGQQRLTTIRDQILGSKIIAITSTNKNTAYKVFEILNAKGMDLTDVDLIKNYIFEKINEDPTTVSPLQKLAFEYWEEVKIYLC